MNILIISGSFYPINAPRSFRTTELAKEFARIGHIVTVYIPPTDFDYKPFLSENPLIKIKFTNGINRSLGKSNGLSYKFKRVLQVLFEYPDINYYFKLKYILKNESNYDLLVSIAVPHPIHWGIARIYKKRRIAKTWVADCGDPYMGCETVSIPHPFYFEWFEKRWCEKCDYISVPTVTSFNGYYPEYRDKIRVIPQGFNFNEINFKDYIKNPVPTFAFAGGFINGFRDPKLLMYFLCTTDRPFKFYYYGSNGHQFLDQYKSILGDKLIINEQVPRNRLLPLISQMDFLINISNGTNVQTSSKLIDYTLTHRPILTIESNDIKIDTMREFLDGNYEHQDPALDISQYDIRDVAGKFLSLCFENH